MKPLFVRELSDPERHALQTGLRSSDGFTVRRCHILLASARGDTTTVIAQAVGCTPQAVRNVLRGECPEIGGITPPSPIAGVGGRPVQRGGRTRNRARRCRPHTGPAAAGRPRVETIASVATCSYAD